MLFVSGCAAVGDVQLSCCHLSAAWFQDVQLSETCQQLKETEEQLSCCQRENTALQQQVVESQQVVASRCQDIERLNKREAELTVSRPMVSSQSNSLDLL